MKPTSYLSLFLVIVFGLPLTAEANTGTLLMMAKAVHVTYGNVAIGILEGCLLWKLSKTSFLKCIILMILANFVSTLIGVPFFHKLELALPLGWNNGRGLFWLLVFQAYFFTVIFELPFIWLAFRGTPLSHRKAIRASLLLQSISYLLLIGWYGMATPQPVKVVDPSAMTLPADVKLYFIATTDGDVYSGSLRDRKWKRIYDLPPKWNTGLFSRESPRMRQSWDLMVSTNRWENESSTSAILVEECFATGVKPIRKNYGIIPELGGTNTSWEIWHYVGRLRGYNKKTSQSFWFTMGTPFCNWYISDAILLPSDKILLRLFISSDHSHDHICIYDPLTDELAIIARGRSPLAVLKNINTSTASD
jgi:hypothetical protein